MNIAAPDIKRRALGKGLDSLLPRVPAAPAPSATETEGGKPLEIPLDQIDRNPFQTRLHRRQRSRSAGPGAPPGQRPLPAHRRRAPLARLRAGRQDHHPRHPPPGLRRAGHGNHHSREPPARRPQPHGAGPRLRPPLARVPHDPGADGRAHRQGSRHCS